MQVSVRISNGRLDSMEATMGTSVTCEFRTGLPPANCAAADSGTLVGTINLPTDYMANASARTKGIAGSWSTTAAANGLIGHFRMKGSGTCDVQGVCAQTWQASTAYVVGQHAANGGNAYRCTTAGTSASSGGPTGTGGSISDGTVVWAYIAPVDMLVDNTNVVSGQTVGVQGFTITDPNG
jgi:hypothetical protein